SAQCTSNIGDLAGMRMYSVRVGTMSSSQARWTKARVRSLSMVMDGYSTHPERIALTGGDGDEADRSRGGTPGDGDTGQRPERARAPLRARLRREPGQGPGALVAQRQRGQADRALAQLLPDPPRQGCPAVAHRHRRRGGTP